MTKISIIAPVYNVEDYIKRCIDSVLSQSFKDWELILVDDCGTDNSMDIVKEYASQDKRIKFIESNENVGPMLAREKGYKSSIGEYIAFIDSDDTLPSTALEALYKAAIKTNADIVVGESVQISFNGDSTMYLPLKEYRKWERKEVLLHMLERTFPHTLWGKLIKGEMVRDNDVKSYYGLTNAEDAYLFYQIVNKSGSIYTIHDTVYYYWMHATSSTNKMLTYKAVNSMAVFRAFQYDLLKKEFLSIDNDYYFSLYYEISNIAKRFPYRVVKEIYSEKGICLNMTMTNLLNFYPPLVALKVFVKTHIYRHLSRLFLLS